MTFEEILAEYYTKGKGKDSYIVCRVNKWRKAAEKVGIDTHPIEVVGENYPSELEGIVVEALFQCYNTWSSKPRTKTVQSYIFHYWDRRISSLLLKYALKETNEHIDTVSLYSTIKNVPIENILYTEDVMLEEDKEHLYKVFKEVAIKRVRDSNLDEEIKAICVVILTSNPQGKNLKAQKENLEQILRREVGAYTTDFDMLIDCIISDIESDNTFHKELDFLSIL